jgi:uncharacterized protein YkwD
MKRKLITILLTTLMLNVYSQTPLESKVFQKINDYRVENGVNRLKWDDATYKSTQIHTEYMIKDGKLSHTENSETPNWWDRLNKGYVLGGENCGYVPIYDSSLEELSHEMVESWISSAPHNKALLNKNATVGAVSSGIGMDLENWNGTTYNLRYFTLVVWGEAN